MQTRMRERSQKYAWRGTSLDIRTYGRALYRMRYISSSSSNYALRRCFFVSSILTILYKNTHLIVALFHLKTALAQAQFRGRVLADGAPCAPPIKVRSRRRELYVVVLFTSRHSRIRELLAHGLVHRPVRLGAVRRTVPYSFAAAAPRDRSTYECAPRTHGTRVARGLGEEGR